MIGGLDLQRLCRSGSRHRRAKVLGASRCRASRSAQVSSRLEV